MAAATASGGDDGAQSSRERARERRERARESERGRGARADVRGIQGDGGEDRQAGGRGAAAACQPCSCFGRGGGI